MTKHAPKTVGTDLGEERRQKKLLEQSDGDSESETKGGKPAKVKQGQKRSFLEMQTALAIQSEAIAAEKRKKRKKKNNKKSSAQAGNPKPEK